MALANSNTNARAKQGEQTASPQQKWRNTQHSRMKTTSQSQIPTDYLVPSEAQKHRLDYQPQESTRD